MLSVFRSRLTINQLPNVVPPQTEFKVSHKHCRRPLKSATSTSLLRAPIYIPILHSYIHSYLFTYPYSPIYASATVQTVSQCVSLDYQCAIPNQTCNIAISYPRAVCCTHSKLSPSLVWKTVCIRFYCIRKTKMCPLPYFSRLCVQIENFMLNYDLAICMSVQHLHDYLPMTCCTCGTGNYLLFLYCIIALMA